jgi:hypothetical protein
MRRTFLDLRWLLPDPVVGALLGFLVGYMAAMSLVFIGIVTLPGFVLLTCGILGAIAGCALGIRRQGQPGRGKTIAGWCATMTVAVGVVSFLLGFIGPLLLAPHANQGPLLGIFITGPLGAAAGALCGVIIGLVVPVGPARR